MNGETWIDDNGDGDCDPGEGVEYVMFIRNEGTVTLGEIQVSDDLLRDRTDCGQPEGGHLAPKAGMTCTGTYQVRKQSSGARTAYQGIVLGGSKPLRKGNASEKGK